jgi:hypothetical protein
MHKYLRLENAELKKEVYILYFHFLLTDQCTIQNITKLVFSTTTLKFKIWLKFL